MDFDKKTGWVRSARAALGITGFLVAMIHGTGVLASDDASAAGHGDLCRLLTKADVSRALKVTIVRAEALDTEEVGCEFSAQGSPADATAGHTVQLAKSTAAAHGATLDGPTEKLIETFSKGIFQGSDADKSATATARHSGEVRVFTIAIQPGDANDQMPITRRTMAGLSPKGVTTVVGLGDEAFDSGGAMITVRKGKKMIQFTYPSCACTTKDVVPLARKVVDAL